MKNFLKLWLPPLAFIFILAAVILDRQTNIRFDPASIDEKIAFISDELGTSIVTAAPASINVLDELPFLEEYIKRTPNPIWARIYLNVAEEQKKGQAGFYDIYTFAVYINRKYLGDQALIHELGHHVFNVIFQRSVSDLVFGNEEELVREITDKYISQKSWFRFFSSVFKGVLNF